MAGGYYTAIRLGPDQVPSRGTVIARAPTYEEVLPLWKPGVVCICWHENHVPTRRLSKSGLASVRQKRLRRRLDRKFPLLADELEATEHAARPEFFAGEREA